MRAMIGIAVYNEEENIGRLLYALTADALEEVEAYTWSLLVPMTTPMKS